MDYEADDEQNHSIVGRQQSLKGRVGDSMAHLQRTLDNNPGLSPPRRGARRAQSPHAQSPRAKSPGSARSPRARGSPQGAPRDRPRGSEQADYSYGSAVGRLRSLLRKHDSPSPKSVHYNNRPHMSPSEALSYAPSAYTPIPLTPYRSMPLPRGQIPTQEECVPVLQNQAVLVQQLEAENRYCREELNRLQLTARQIVEENRILHDELKRSVIQELLHDGTDVPGVPSAVSAPQLPPEGRSGTGRQMNRDDYGRWQSELERIHALHTAKASRLEAQLQHAREEAVRYEKETEELRKELRMRDSLNKADPELLGIAAGLCIRCATNEAVVQPSGLSQGSSVNALTRERDEMMEQLAMMKMKYEELRQREDDMYQQVKRSVEIVEQSHLEATQVIIQRDQYKEELVAMQQRVAEHADDVMNKMAQERELVRKEFKAERDELNLKVKELAQSLVETQNSLDKTTRDKISLIADLEASKGHIDICDLDYGKATDNMKMSMTQANVERNVAVGEMGKLKKEMNRQEKEREQERSRLRQELYDVRRRLGQAEKELVETKEECIHLHNTSQTLERECHLAKLAKESIEKNRSDDLKNTQKRAEQREAELNMLLDQLEAKHTNTSSELENIVSSQSGLIQKLRGECRKSAHQLEDVTQKYRGDNKKLKAQNDQLKERLNKSHRHLRDLEDQHVQHGTLQDKMRHRLKQMDQHAGKTTQQVMDLLAKESAVMRDRQLLAKEVEFLRQQMLDRNEADMSRFYSSQKGLVDDILLDVRGQEEARIRDAIPEYNHAGSPVLDNELVLQAQADLEAQVDRDSAC